MARTSNKPKRTNLVRRHNRTVDDDDNDQPDCLAKDCCRGLIEKTTDDNQSITWTRLTSRKVLLRAIVVSCTLIIVLHFISHDVTVCALTCSHQIVFTDGDLLIESGELKANNDDNGSDFEPFGSRGELSETTSDENVGSFTRGPTKRLDHQA